MPLHPRRLLLLTAATLFVALLLQMTLTLTAIAQVPSTESGSESTTPGPVRLRQPLQAPADERNPTPGNAAPSPTVNPLQPQSEFERFVQRLAGPGTEIRRFGADLVSGNAEPRGMASETSPLVPADYLVGPGDEILLTIWGSVDADLRLAVDRGGRINIPRVGTVQVSGVRSADLPDVISRRVGQTFKNFQLSATLGQLRGIRVFVTGFVNRPGAYTISSLSGILSALLRAGGPAAAGSYRSIEVRRGAAVITAFDLYDLLAKGDRSADQVLQAGDVVHVNAVGIQVGVVGSVNKPSVIELKANETVADALRYAGGFSAVADRGRMAIERLEDRSAVRVQQLDLPRDLALPLGPGDVMRAFSVVDVALPIGRQSKRVRIEGEVQRPGEYILAEGSSVRNALQVAGGFTPAAYVFATEFTRQSVQVSQQENYDRALRDLETDLARGSSQRVSTTEEATNLTARSAASARLIERLRALKPSGRIILQIEPTGNELPDLALEDGDRIYVPARPTTVGVFGSVFNAASYLHAPDRLLGDYLRLAGGPTKGADDESLFVVRANGSVISRRQSSGWFNRGGDITTVPALPGDTLFVPEEFDKTTFVQAAKDWTQILYQFGIGIAGIRSAVK